MSKLLARPHVLSHKVRQPPAVGLARARLELPLLDPDGPRLILVSAPAGSGKSTLLARAASSATVPVAWYRVTAEDADPATFAANLGAVVGAAVDLRSDPLLDEVDGLLRTLDGLRGPALLVLDDVHEISGAAAEAALGELLWRLPAHLRVALAARRPPEINLPRLRAAGELAEITSDDLRFRVWEVEELFTVVHGAPLTPETAAALTRRTGGWAAGLQLFHLATAHKSSLARQRAVSELGPRSRMIRSYLTRNVLAELPERRREFLVRTSALGRLSGPLCDSLLDTTGSADVLEELERDQVFTTSLDEGLTFRYHEVLQRHLELMLVQDLGVEAARDWYARCAALLERDGAAQDALRAYALADDWTAAARLIGSGSAETTAGLDELLPERLLRDDPWLALAEARRRLRRGAVTAAVSGFAHARTLLDAAPFRERCDEERASAQVWLAGVDPSAAAEWIQRLRRATRRQPGRPPVARTSPPDVLASAVESLLAGEFGVAGARFAEVYARAGDDALLCLGAQLGGIVAELAEGRFGDCAARLEELTVDADAAGYPWFERLARGMLAAVLAVESDAPWRLDGCSELLVECDRAGDEWGAALLQLAAAVAAAVVSDGSRTARFDDAAARLEQLDAGVLATWSRTLQARWDAPSPAPGAGRQHEIRIACFGRFAVEAAGAPIGLGELRPRALSLLRLLALEHGRPLHRERLIETFWPGVSLAVGARRLQVALSSIRQALRELGAADVVRRVGDSYALVLPGATVDVHDFEELVRAAAGTTDPGERADLRVRAVQGYAGELLPEEGAAEHLVEERDRLRLTAASTACALARDLAALGRHDAAVWAARRAIELDRYQDVAWTLLADALTAGGDKSAAARVRSDHERIRAEFATDRPGIPIRFPADPVIA